MKNLFYIFFILMLSSCGLLNKTNKSKPDLVNEMVTVDTIYFDDSSMQEHVDSIEVMKLIEGNGKKGSKKLVHKKIIFYKRSTVLNFGSDTSKVVLESVDSREIDTDGEGVADNEIKINRKPSSVDDKIEVDNTSVEDKTTPSQVDNPSLGIVAYSIPKEMQVGKTYTVKLRISKEKNKVQLVDGNGIPIADIKVDSRIIIASIRVEPIMSAKLVTDSSKMIVQSVSTEVQDIEKEGFTEWAWRLTPLKGGDVLLRIVVSIKQKIDNDVILKDIPVYDDVVAVKSNVAFNLQGFIAEYWQWLMTTIIIPLVIWFYNKKKKKEKS